MAKLISAEELRALSTEDLQAKLKDAKEELFNLRFQSATGQLDNHGRLKAVKRDIARIYTVLRERELGIRAVPTPQPAKTTTKKKAAEKPAEEA